MSYEKAGKALAQNTSDKPGNDPIRMILWNISKALQEGLDGIQQDLALIRSELSRLKK